MKKSGKNTGSQATEGLPRAANRHVCVAHADGHAHPGISLLIAVLFIGVMLFAAVGLSAQIIETYRNIGRSVRTEQAYYVAESMANIATAIAKDEAYSAGLNVACVHPFAAGASGATGATQNAICGDATLALSALESSMSGAVSNMTMKFRVIGRSECAVRFTSGVSMYSVPVIYSRGGDGTCNSFAAGVDPAADRVATGDVAEKCDPDLYNDVLENTLDDPCHWNKLKFNQPVAIPLYYFDEDENAIVNPADSVGRSAALGALKIRVRTPCVGAVNGVTECLDNVAQLGQGPSTLYAGDGYRDALKQPAPLSALPDGDNNLAVPGRYEDGEDGFDPTLVRWEILGLDSATGEPISMIARTKFDEGNDKRYLVETTTTTDDDKKKNYNSEIFSSLINNPTSYKGSDYADHTVIDLGNNLPSDDWGVIIENADKNEVYIRDKLNPTLGSAETALAQPVLLLHLVTRLQRQNPGDTYGDYMPYLEYQILADVPLSGEKTLIEGRARIGDITRTAEVELKQPVPLGRFALEN